MAYPSKNVDLFRRVALARLDDAVFLVYGNNDRGTAAVYLGGYVVECALKMLILANVPRNDEDDVFRSFRGGTGHSFDHLAHQLTSSGRFEIPREVRRKLADVTGWQVRMRYNPGRTAVADARAFLQAAEGLLRWAEARL